MIFKVFKESSEDGQNNPSNQSINNNRHEFLHEKCSMIRSMTFRHQQNSKKRNTNLHKIKAEDNRRLRSDIIENKTKFINEEPLTWKDLAYSII